MSLLPFQMEVERRRLQALRRISSVQLAVLLWGPTPAATSPVALARAELRRALEAEGHLVNYSEDLHDPKSSHSIIAQQVADVESHDITFSLPDSAGSIAEAHDFARIPTISHKVVTFIDQAHNNGYSNATLLQMQTVISCRVQLYDASLLPGCVIEPASQMTKALQEFLYLYGRKN